MAVKWTFVNPGWSVEPWSPHLRVPCQFVFTPNWSQLIIQICAWTLFSILWLSQVGKPPFEAENNNETYRRITRVDLKSVFTKLFPYQLNLPSIEFNVTAALCHTVRIHLCDKSVLTFNQRSLNRPGFQRMCLKAPGTLSRSCLEKNPTRGFPLTRWVEYNELMRCTVPVILWSNGQHFSAWNILGSWNTMHQRRRLRMMICFESEFWRIFWHHSARILKGIVEFSLLFRAPTLVPENCFDNSVSPIAIWPLGKCDHYFKEMPCTCKWNRYAFLHLIQFSISLVVNFDICQPRHLNTFFTLYQVFSFSVTYPNIRWAMSSIIEH